MSKELLITLAETEVAFRFHFDGTGMLFRDYEKKEISGVYTGAFLSADLKKISMLAKELHCSLEFAEYNCLMTEAADYMTERDCTMFHGVAFLCGEGAYILTAPSGTGKSTQFRNLKHLYGRRCRIINGDKPFLGYNRRGQILVYPSPWNGKEQWAGREHGPLRAIFLLEQGQENVLTTLDKQAAVIPIIEQFIYTAPTRKSVHTVFQMADAMINHIPLYHFKNKGDYASSAMLFEQIVKTEILWQ